MQRFTQEKHRLAIVGLFPELSSPGGVQRAGRHVAAALATYANRCGVLYRFLSLNDPLANHWTGVDGRPFRFWGAGRSKIRFASSALRLANRRPILALVAHPYLAPVAWSMRVAAPGLRYVVLTHGVEVWRPLPPHRQWALRAADCVLVTNGFTGEQLRSVQKVSEERLRDFPLAIESEFLSASTDSDGYLPPPDFPKDGRVVLTVGRLAADERYKGVDTLIYALARLGDSLSDLHLVVVGDGDDRPRLHRIAEDKGLTDRVHFLCGLGQRALIACYKHCEVFAMPSRGEGFGLVFLEAMALAKPVVGGAHGGTPGLIEDGVTGFLVPHGDVERLADVLERLLSDEGLRLEIGRKAQERVRGAYLYEQLEERLAGIVEETCPLEAVKNRPGRGDSRRHGPPQEETRTGTLIGH